MSYDDDSTKTIIHFNNNSKHNNFLNSNQIKGKNQLISVN